MAEVDLVTGYSPGDAQKVTTHLTRLFKYLDMTRIIVVGGLAIRYHLNKAGIDYPVRGFNDLDLVSESYEAMDPALTADFLVYHNHLPRPEDGLFYLVLVDKESHTKVDIFSPNADEETILVPFGEYQVRVAGIEDQLVKTVYDISRVSAEAHVDPKQYQDTRLLSQIADMEKADRIWRARGFAQYPQSLAEAIKRAEDIAAENPNFVEENPFKKPQPYECSYCTSTKDFPLTPMAEVFKELGYVE